MMMTTYFNFREYPEKDDSVVVDIENQFGVAINAMLVFRVHTLHPLFVNQAPMTFEEIQTVMQWVKAKRDG